MPYHDCLSHNGTKILHEERKGMKGRKTDYSEVTPLIARLTGLCSKDVIPAELYERHNVYRGLRDLKGNGVLAGLTSVSDITAKQVIDGEDHPARGKLYYRGIDIEEIVAGVMGEGRFGFEETVYLLMFGDLPNEADLTAFRSLLSGYCSLPTKFTRDVIMKAPSGDMMNALARGVLTLYSYDRNAEDTSIPNVLRQCLQLIAVFPLLAVYGYHAFMHYGRNRSLIIHKPDPKKSIAENILHILRPDQGYTELEAHILDLTLILHAEHGGGNNSTFTTRVVSSSGTDTYSAIAAAIGSLKGPKHGGANIKVYEMMADMRKAIKKDRSEGKVADYLTKVLHKEAYDRSGLIYGIGHAIYSLNDPRADIIESFVRRLCDETGRGGDYDLYMKVAKIAPEIIAKERRMYKGVSANIDFYSGFVYDMLGIPTELFTPMFAISRISGWSAHRIEELVTSNRIIRPAYKTVSPRRGYVPMGERGGPEGA